MVEFNYAQAYLKAKSETESSNQPLNAEAAIKKTIEDARPSKANEASATQQNQTETQPVKSNEDNTGVESVPAPSSEQSQSDAIPSESVATESDKAETKSESPPASRASVYSHTGNNLSIKNGMFSDNAVADAVEYAPKGASAQNQPQVDEPTVAVESSDDDEPYEDSPVNESAEAERQAREASLRQQTAIANKKNPPLQSSFFAKPTVLPDGQVQMSHIKKFPTELAQRIKLYFPEAKTMDEALAAYVFIKEGSPPDVSMTDRLADVVNSYVGNIATMNDMKDELSVGLSKLRETDRLIMQKLDAVELAIIYNLFDRIGFRKGEQLSPGGIEFLEQGIDDMISGLEKQSKLRRTRELNKNGRPYK